VDIGLMDDPQAASSRESMALVHSSRSVPLAMLPLVLIVFRGIFHGPH